MVDVLRSHISSGAIDLQSVRKKNDTLRQITKEDFRTLHNSPQLIIATNELTLMSRVYRGLSSLACCQLNPRNTWGSRNRERLWGRVKRSSSWPDQPDWDVKYDGDDWNSLTSFDRLREEKKDYHSQFPDALVILQFSVVGSLGCCENALRQHCAHPARPWGNDLPYTCKPEMLDSLKCRFCDIDLIIFAEGTLDRFNYESIPGDHVHPYMMIIFPREDRIVQHDYAPCHTTAWLQTAVDTYHNLTESLPARLAAVRAVKGGRFRSGFRENYIFPRSVCHGRCDLGAARSFIGTGNSISLLHAGNDGTKTSEALTVGLFDLPVISLLCFGNERRSLVSGADLRWAFCSRGSAFESWKRKDMPEFGPPARPGRRRQLILVAARLCTHSYENIWLSSANTQLIIRRLMFLARHQDAAGYARSYLSRRHPAAQRYRLMFLAWHHDAAGYARSYLYRRHPAAQRYRLMFLARHHDAAGYARSYLYRRHPAAQRYRLMFLAWHHDAAGYARSYLYRRHPAAKRYRLMFLARHHDAAGYARSYLYRRHPAAQRYRLMFLAWHHDAAGYARSYLSRRHPAAQRYRQIHPPAVVALTLVYCSMPVASSNKLNK
ncbi:hypothetical protein PR048_023606 [Dryococelus australis]|uniref:Uncharacterized protein n=1 Tax=Dryococelus australis TaxID=614101 RepID=A0ABQ9GUL9_9NEOP|nr:hypothetical protein PR048_023606 [Dryococelus australis]